MIVHTIRTEAGWVWLSSVPLSYINLERTRNLPSAHLSPQEPEQLLLTSCRRRSRSAMMSSAKLRSVYDDYPAIDPVSQLSTLQFGTMTITLTPTPIPYDQAFEAIKTAVDAMPAGVKLFIDSGVFAPYPPISKIRCSSYFQVNSTVRASQQGTWTYSLLSMRSTPNAPIKPSCPSKEV